MTQLPQVGPQYDGLFTPWVPVSDLGRAVDWYVRVLNLKLVFHADEIGWAELATATPGAVLGLYRLPGPLPEGGCGPGGATMTFGVQDLESERVRLEGLDVKFGEYDRVIDSLISFVSFEDPDGNPLMFCQVLHSPRAEDEVEWQPTKAAAAATGAEAGS